MTDGPTDPAEKKIIVDEDWKAQVEAEKEEAARKAGRAADEASEAEPPPRGPLPPPTLDFVISSFAMQAMIAMGVIHNPVTGKAEVRLDEAKHFIDTIQMLEAKTEGNRTPQESAVMENVLHELRLTYVTLRERPEAPPS